MLHAVLGDGAEEETGEAAQAPAAHHEQGRVTRAARSSTLAGVPYCTAVRTSADGCAPSVSSTHRVRSSRALASKASSSPLDGGSHPSAPWYCG